VNSIDSIYNIFKDNTNNIQELTVNHIKATKRCSELIFKQKFRPKKKVIINNMEMRRIWK
jgi:hypothetical protein